VSSQPPFTCLNRSSWGLTSWLFAALS